MKIPVSRLDDEDMQNAPKAMARAAQWARELALQTGTKIVIMRDGKLVRETPKPETKKRNKKNGS